jgi:hypothetical protein
LVGKGIQPLELTPYYAGIRTLKAQLFEEETAVNHHGHEIVVPADHYFAAYTGGVIVLPREDFEALYALDEGPAARSYR